MFIGLYEANKWADPHLVCGMQREPSFRTPLEGWGIKLVLTRAAMTFHRGYLQIWFALRT